MRYRDLAGRERPTTHFERYARVYTANVLIVVQGERTNAWFSTGAAISAAAQTLNA